MKKILAWTVWTVQSYWSNAFFDQLVFSLSVIKESFWGECSGKVEVVKQILSWHSKRNPHIFLLLQLHIPVLPFLMGSTTLSHKLQSPAVTPTNTSFYPDIPPLYECPFLQKQAFNARKGLQIIFQKVVEENVPIRGTHISSTPVWTTVDCFN